MLSVRANPDEFVNSAPETLNTRWNMHFKEVHRERFLYAVLSWGRMVASGLYGGVNAAW